MALAADGSILFGIMIINALMQIPQFHRTITLQRFCSMYASKNRNTRRLVIPIMKGRRIRKLHIGQDDYLAAMRKAARELDLDVGRKPLTALHKSKNNYTRKIKHKGVPPQE